MTKDTIEDEKYPGKLKIEWSTKNGTFVALGNKVSQNLSISLIFYLTSGEFPFKPRLQPIAHFPKSLTPIDCSQALRRNGHRDRL